MLFFASNQTVFLRIASFTLMMTPEAQQSLLLRLHERVKEEQILHLQIPTCITCIGKYAFSSCISLTSVIIPESVSTYCTAASFGIV